MRRTEIALGADVVATATGNDTIDYPGRPSVVYAVLLHDGTAMVTNGLDVDEVRSLIAAAAR